MNSYSNNNHCNPCHDHNDNHCNPCHDHCHEIKPQNLNLAVGTPGSLTIPPNITTPTTIATVSVVVDDGRVKIDFASNIKTVFPSTAATAASAIVNFQVFKIVSGQKIPVSGVWSYERTKGIGLVGGLTTSDTFTFFTFECAASCFTGCTTYTVDVISATVSGLSLLGIVLGVPSVTISNATLAATTISD
jgi:hypothetical protein